MTTKSGGEVPEHGHMKMATDHFSSSRRILSVLVALGALAVRGSAPAAAQGPTFKSGVDMVPLTVTVTDPTGNYVTGLTAGDFTVFEDGVEQPLSFFAKDDVAVDVALLVSQYELGYIPVRPGTNGAFRRVMVRVPPSTNALARTRGGYYAPSTRAGN